jgi:hypothetical protein
LGTHPARTDIGRASKKGPRTTADEVMARAAILDECAKRSGEAYDDVFRTLVLLTKGAQDNKTSKLILEQLKYADTLGFFRTLIDGASKKLISDHLFAANEELQGKLTRLTDRYNAVVDSLSSVSLPISYQKPARLTCKSTSNHLGVWSTLMTTCE